MILDTVLFNNNNNNKKGMTTILNNVCDIMIQQFKCLTEGFHLGGQGGTHSPLMNSCPPWTAGKYC